MHKLAKICTKTISFLLTFKVGKTEKLTTSIQSHFKAFNRKENLGVLDHSKIDPQLIGYPNIVILDDDMK